MTSVKAIRRFTVRSVLPDSLAGLEELSMNLRWSWHPQTTDLFQSMDAKSAATGTGQLKPELGLRARAGVITSLRSRIYVKPNTVKVMD